MTSDSASMVRELEETRQSLEDRFCKELDGAASELARMKEEVKAEEEERDQVLRSSATVLTRARAAALARLSISRVDQIIGGAA